MRKYFSFLSQPKYAFVVLQVIAGVITIILGKVVAVYFDPEEFGKYFIYTSAVGMYTTIVATPAIQAYRHFYFRDPEGLIHFYRSVFIWLACLVAFVLILLGTLGVIPFFIILIILGQIVFQNNSALQLANINIQGKTTLQGILQVLVPIINLALIYGFVYGFQKATAPYLWSSLVLTDVALVYVGYWVFKPNQGFRWLTLKEIVGADRLKNLIKYVKPLLLLPLFVWMVNNLDRYIIDYYSTKEDVGLYSAAYSIGSKVFMLLGGGIIAYLNSSVYKQTLHSLNHNTLYKITLKRISLYLGFGAIGVVFLYFGSDLVGRLLLSDQYSGSFPLIPYLAFANLLLTSLFFLEQVIYAIGRTKYILYHYIFGAAANGLLNIFLIPGYGLWGAAYAMILSSAIQLIILFLLFRNNLKLSKVVV